jgi:hypothetical protein
MPRIPCFARRAYTAKQKKHRLRSSQFTGSVVTNVEKIVTTRMALDEELESDNAEHSVYLAGQNTPVTITVRDNHRAAKIFFATTY